jgi:hypothetical protein
MFATQKDEMKVTMIIDLTLSDDDEEPEEPEDMKVAEDTEGPSPDDNLIFSDDDEKAEEAEEPMDSEDTEGPSPDDPTYQGVFPRPCRGCLKNYEKLLITAGLSCWVGNREYFLRTWRMKHDVSDFYCDSDDEAYFAKVLTVEDFKKAAAARERGDEDNYDNWDDMPYKQRTPAAFKRFTAPGEKGHYDNFDDMPYMQRTPAAYQQFASAGKKSPYFL